MSVRVEAVAFSDHYTAVFRRDGQPDEFLVDDKGKPQRFASASIAVRQGRKALSLASEPAKKPDDPLKRWRAEKDRELAAERDRVFGTAGPATLDRNGRTVVIERKGRRR